LKKYLIALLAIAAVFALQGSGKEFNVTEKTAAAERLTSVVIVPTPIIKEVIAPENNEPMVTEAPKNPVVDEVKKNVEKVSRSAGHKGSPSRGSKGSDKHLLTEVDGKLREADYSVNDAVKAIDDYYDHHNCFLAGYGKYFVEEAIRNQTDWRMTPAIAMRESTGGNDMFRPNNPFGWGSVSFSSIQQAISTVTRNLAGNNPNTENYYRNKTIREKLRKYNSVIDAYPDEVREIMRDIENKIA